jgi:hypothetical protein
MDLKHAVTHVFDDRRWPVKLGKAGLIASVPVLGPVLLSAYALQSTRAAATGDPGAARGEWRWDAMTLMTGLKCQLLTVICGLAAALLTLPLWNLESSEPASSASSVDPTPVLVGAFQGPTHLLATLIMALFTALCLARFAITGSAWSALDVGAIWSHLRAEPALWLSVSAVGFAIAEGPVALAWLLPLPASWQIPALLLATVFLRPLAVLAQAHLIGQAYRWSAQAMARRRPLIVKVRW